MTKIKDEVITRKAQYDSIVYINCAAVVHTEYFYYVNKTFETNVLGMKNIFRG